MGNEPVLLDLFCGAGGAAMGYHCAGFDVVGVDSAPQKHYPFTFRQGDALACLDTLLAGDEWGGYRLGDFAAIHASPPCQDYSLSRAITHPKRRGAGVVYPRLIAPVRDRLRATSLPYIIENVAGAALTDRAMDNPVMLCGTSFGLRVERHRFFESNRLLFAAGSCHHQPGNVTVRRKRAEYIGVWSDVTYLDKHGRLHRRPRSCPFPIALSAMGVTWPMTFSELGESIPPAYTEWIGRQLLAAVQNAA